jgi:membrane protease YdiL (CAAX protease family)
MTVNDTGPDAVTGRSGLRNGKKAADGLPAVAAVALFALLFIGRGFGPLDFWWSMSGAVLLLVGLGAVLDRGYPASLARDPRSGALRKLVLGLLAAAALYGIFWVGNEASRWLFPFASGGIGRVYDFKAGAALPRIILLMALIIGPGEEIFWRAYLQRRWQARFGRWPGFLAAAALYTLVHAASGNVMLVLAAAVCGVFWGFLYMRTGSILLVAVSHTAWDLAVFVIWPFS